MKDLKNNKYVTSNYYLFHVTYFFVIPPQPPKHCCQPSYILLCRKYYDLKYLHSA